uniref:Uncharacterized protein n=1 Tax=Anopheles culicifacies TaxID=139723 RepID=A0A182M8D4_9DIPT
MLGEDPCTSTPLEDRTHGGSTKDDDAVSAANGRYLYIPVDVEPIVLACQHHTTIVHKGHIETLRVLHFALHCRYQLSILGEDGKVEVVVIVRDKDFAAGINAHANWIVCDALATDLPQELALVVEHLDAVCTIVANEDLLLVVNNDPVRELEMFAAAKFLQHIAGLVEDDDTHHLALNDHDAALTVHSDTAWMLENVGTELAHELTVLVVDLDLVCWRALCYDDVARITHNGNAIRIEQLAIPLAAFAELELEASLLIKDLYPMIVRVRDDDVVLRLFPLPPLLLLLVLLLLLLVLLLLLLLLLPLPMLPPLPGAPVPFDVGGVITLFMIDFTRLLASSLMVKLSELSRGWVDSKLPTWSIFDAPVLPPPKMLLVSGLDNSKHPPPSNPPSVGVAGAVVVTVLAAIVPVAREPIDPNVFPPPPVTLPTPVIRYTEWPSKQCIN